MTDKVVPVTLGEGGRVIGTYTPLDGSSGYLLIDDPEIAAKVSGGDLSDLSWSIIE